MSAAWQGIAFQTLEDEGSSINFRGVSAVVTVVSLDPAKFHFP
jgi:hypothetical protein